MENKNMYVLTATNRNDASTETYGVFTTHERAAEMVLYYIFANGEKAEYHTEQCEDNPYKEQFMTDTMIWTIEDMEVDATY